MVSNLNTNNSLLERLFMHYPLDFAETLKSVGKAVTLEEPAEQKEDVIVINGEGLRVTRVKRGAAKPVAACDASVVKVVESSNGFVIALRGAIVRREGGFKAEVIGPFLKFVSYESVGPVVNVEQVVREELRFFEVNLQMYAASIFSDSILLLDSTLTVANDVRGNAVMRVLEEAERNSNVVMGFAKESGVVISGTSLSYVASNLEPPFVVDITEQLKSSLSYYTVAGKVFLARFSDRLFPYRVDLYPPSNDVENFNSLLASDAMLYGYPETLSLAHALCTFKKIDVIALQRLFIEDMDSLFFEAPRSRPSILAPLDWCKA